MLCIVKDIINDSEYYIYPLNNPRSTDNRNAIVFMEMPLMKIMETTDRFQECQFECEAVIKFELMERNLSVKEFENPGL